VRCSSRVLRVLARLRFRSVVFLCFGWARFQTVRVCRADSPRVPSRQSAWLVQTDRPSCRTVRQSRAALFLGSIPPSFLRASACASRNLSLDLRLFHNLVVLAVSV
jgi:hypothetical protein